MREEHLAKINKILHDFSKLSDDLFTVRLYADNDGTYMFNIDLEEFTKLTDSSRDIQIELEKVYEQLKGEN